MRIQTITMFLLLLSLISCEGIIRGKGKVISKSDKSSLDSVRISFFDKVVYSDKYGNFSLEQFVGCVPSCPDLEVILSKEGYEPKYANLTKETRKGESQKQILIELTPTKGKIVVLLHDKTKRLFFYGSVIFALIALFTFIFILTDLKNKAFWIPIILFGTIVIQYNYLEKKFYYNFFRPSVFMYMKHTFEPTWYKLNLPIGLIVFWIYFLLSARKHRQSKTDKQYMHSARQ